MNPLEQVALEFCWAVLGWKKPEPSGNPCVELMDLTGPEPRFFRFTDLNAVIHAAQGWLDTLGYSHGQKAQRAVKEAMWSAFVMHDDIGAALMATCVAAARKLREAT